MNETNDHTRPPREKAKRYIIACDHIITKTYPTLKNVKLLARCIEYLFLAMTNVMNSILEKERELKTIPPFQQTYKSKIELFPQIAHKYNIDDKDIAFIKELHILITFHKKSAMEFTKNNELVICSDEFHTKKISEETIQEYLAQARNITLRI